MEQNCVHGECGEMSIGLAVFLFLVFTMANTVFCLLVLSRLDMFYTELKDRIDRQNPFYHEGKTLVEKWERQLNGEKVDE